MNKFATSLLILLPLACASDDLGAATETGDSTSSGTTQGGETSGETTASSSTVSSGESTSSHSGSSSGSEDGSTSTSATDSTTGSTSSDSSGSDSSSSSSTTTGGGQMLFPGDPCDPFVDTCLDVNNTDYECHRAMVHLGNNVWEHYFECMEFEPLANEDGELYAVCGNVVWEPVSCRTGHWCTPAVFLDEANCAHTPNNSCCAPVCAWGDICGNGQECQVVFWQADLADYLDIYNGIGYCVE